LVAVEQAWVVLAPKEVETEVSQMEQAEVELALGFVMDLLFPQLAEELEEY
jgi:hypothetical protein